MLAVEEEVVWQGLDARDGGGPAGGGEEVAVAKGGCFGVVVVADEEDLVICEGGDELGGVVDYLVGVNGRWMRDRGEGEFTIGPNRPSVYCVVVWP